MRKLWLAALVLMGLAVAQNRGGSLTVAILAEPPALDPTTTASAEIARILYDNVLQGLVKLNAKGEIVPALAEGWRASASGLTYTFSLRKNVKFHDGSSFTAEDVVFKFNRAKDPKSGHRHPEYYRDITTVSARDPYTVVFTLKQPNQDFLFNLAAIESTIGPKGRLDQQKTQPIGTGPFKFAAWDRGVGVRLERFDGYYDPRLPYLDKVTFRFLPDPNAQIAALKAGDIDAIGYGVTPENALALQKDANFKVVQGTSTAEITVGMNNSKPPFNDIRVRKAMQYAVNRDELLQSVMLGFGTKIGSHRSPAETCYEDQSGMYKYDPEQAKKLLAEAGYGPGNPLKFTFSLAAPYPYEKRIGEAMAAQFERAGIQAKLEVVEWSTWINRIFLGGDYQMTIIGHSEPNDIGVYTNPKYYFKYNSPEFNKLFTQYLRTNDPKKACETMKQLQRKLAEDAVNIWVLNGPFIAALKKNVMGWWPNQPTPSMNVTEVYLAK